MNPHASPRLRLRDKIFEVEMIGDGFTANSAVQLDHEFETLGLDGVQHHAFGSAATSSDGDGHFEGVTFSLPNQSFEIAGKATDVASGISTIAPVLRPQV